MILSAYAKRLAASLKAAGGAALIEFNAGTNYAAGTIGAAVRQLFAGPTLTGPLTLPGNGSAALHAVTKQQMDAAVSGALASVADGVDFTGPVGLPGKAVQPLQAVPLKQLMNMRYFGATSVRIDGAEAWRAPDATTSTIAAVGDLVSLGNPFRFTASEAGTCRVRALLSVSILGGTAPSSVLVRPTNSGQFWNPEFQAQIVAGESGRFWVELAAPGVPAGEAFGVAVRLVGAQASTQASLNVHVATHEFFLG